MEDVVEYVNLLSTNNRKKKPLPAIPGTAQTVDQSKDLKVGQSNDHSIDESNDHSIGQSDDFNVCEANDLYEVGGSNELQDGESGDINVDENNDLHAGETDDLEDADRSDSLAGGSSDLSVMAKGKPRPVGNLPQSHLLDNRELRRKLLQTCLVSYVVMVSLAALTLTGYVVHRETFAGDNVVIACASVQIQHTTSHQSCDNCPKLTLKDACQSTSTAVDISNDSIRINTEGKYWIQSVLFYANHSTEDCSKHKPFNINLVSLISKETKISLAHKRNCSREETVSSARDSLQLEAHESISITQSGDIPAGSPRLVLYLEMILLKRGN